MTNGITNGVLDSAYGASGSAASIALADRGNWTTTTAYVVGDVVTQGGSRYICETAHTAGTFATDLAASKWVVLADAPGSAATAQTTAQTYAATQDQATVAKLTLGQRGGSVIPFQVAPAISQEWWQLANFQGGYNTTTLTPSVTGNGTNGSVITRINVGNMANGDTSFRLEFDYTYSLDGWGGVSVTMSDAGATVISGVNRQYLVASGTGNKPTGHVIFEFKSPANNSISYIEVKVEKVSNSTTGTCSISNVTLKQTANEQSRPMFVSQQNGGTGPACYVQAWDDKTRTWKIAEINFGADGALTPYAYEKVAAFTTNAIWNSGKIAIGDPTFVDSSTGVTSSTDNTSLTTARTYLRSGNNDQVIEVWNGSAWELRCNTHGGETPRGSATLKVDTGSGLAAYTMVAYLKAARRFQLTLPTQVAKSTGGTFANVDHTFTVFSDGVVRCDRTTTFQADTLTRNYFEWMSSHPTDRGFIGRLGRGTLVLQEINTLAKLAVPVAPTLGTSTTGGTLAAATYYYKTTKLTTYGETTGSPSTSQVTTGTTSSNTVTFVGDANATGYGIYRGTVSGQETLIGYAPAGATSYVDTNATPPQPGKFPPLKNAAGTYGSIDTVSYGTTDVSWAAWYDQQTGFVYGNIYDRDSPLTRTQVGNVWTRLEGATANIQKNYANLFWASPAADGSITIPNGTVFTATHYSFIYTPVSADRWHDEIAARAASLTTLATMYPNT